MFHIGQTVSTIGGSVGVLLSKKKGQFKLICLGREIIELEANIFLHDDEVAGFYAYVKKQNGSFGIMQIERTIAKNNENYLLQLENGQMIRCPIGSEFIETVPSVVSMEH